MLNREGLAGRRSESRGSREGPWVGRGKKRVGSVWWAMRGGW